MTSQCTNRKKSKEIWIIRRSHYVFTVNFNVILRNPFIITLWSNIYFNFSPLFLLSPTEMPNSEIVKRQTLEVRTVRLLDNWWTWLSYGTPHEMLCRSTHWFVWSSTRSHLSSATRKTVLRLMGSKMVWVRPSRTSSTVRLFLKEEKKTIWKETVRIMAE